MDLALILRITPSEAEEQPFGDSILLLERHYDQEMARARLQASFHGYTIS